MTYHRVCGEAGCPDPHYARDKCQHHYQKAYPKPRQTDIKRPRGALDALMKRSVFGPPTDECIEVTWTKTRPKKKFPDGTGMLASRAVWIMAHGDPGDLYILHTCHNDRCINLAHLYPGTQKQNIKDMIDAGRRYQPQTKGRKYKKSVAQETCTL